MAGWRVVLPLAALVSGCGTGAAGRSAEQESEAVAETPAAHGRHLGFDTNIYPGDAAMRAWREAGAPYEWVGYYLPAPCHRDASWSGKRTALRDMGYGLAVLYVGQQWWERPVTRTARAKRGPVVCHNDLVTPARGRIDADDAIARTEAEGFPRGTVIFLDIERVERLPQRLRDYYRAWTARVLEHGRFRPGFYAHTHNAERIHGDVRAVYDSLGAAGEPPFWIANTRAFALDKLPHEVGHAFAAVWQGVLDTHDEWNGVRIPIDVNIARVPSPSFEEVAQGD